MSTLILSLSDPRATLDCVGGKGMSLAKLARQGLPVPDAFHITTEAYRQFVAANDLRPAIDEALRQLDVSQPASLEAASATIARLFASARMPADLTSAITAAYLQLSGGTAGADSGRAVAVRSSATAEDLPEASFAGQQESYLNVRGFDGLLMAVQRCWASLWTARAIAYRARMGTPPDSVDLAVVIQELVEAEASGVMFTANPVTGKRDEMLITATWGLGEAIVSGSVTPDTLTVEKATGKVIRRETATKLVMTVRTEAGTHDVPVPGSRKRKPVLSDEQATKLAGLGAAIEKSYEMPMDIEWALAAGRFAIVQARPITALPPEETGTALEWPLPHPKAVLARGSFAEFVPEPISPLFATLAVPIAREETLKLMAGIGVTGRDAYLFSVLNDYVYVGFVMTPNLVWKMVRATGAMTKTVVKTAASLTRAARDRYLAELEKWDGRDLAALSAPELIEGAAQLFRTTAEYYTAVQSAPIPAASMTEIGFSKFYDLLVKRKGDPDASKLLFGTESQPLRAEKALFDLAMWARQRPELGAYLSDAPAGEICAALGSEPKQIPGLQEFAVLFEAYVRQYGHTIYDLDFAKPLPLDDPAPLVETIKVFLNGRNSPYDRQRSALTFREQATQAISSRLDPLRRKYFLKLLRAAQEIAPLREDGIADIGLGYPQIRRMWMELGHRLAAGGAIACAADVYWLELQELKVLADQMEAGQPLKSLAVEVDSRKTKWEAMRHITPPNTLPQGTWLARFFPGDRQTSATMIKGYGASAGRVTARACVMLGPEDFGKMQQGDVIVAGITTPAWTPLFARAAAIVTDIGGPLSHSSIVAREYGIPAVLATSVGTRRIRDGQTITVDGTAGIVVLVSA